MNAQLALAGDPRAKQLRADASNPRLSPRARADAEAELDKLYAAALHQDRAALARAATAGPSASIIGADHLQGRSRVLGEGAGTKKRAEETESEVDIEDAKKRAYKLLSDPDTSPETKAEVREILRALGVPAEEIEEIDSGAKAIGRRMGGFAGWTPSRSAL